MNRPHRPMDRLVDALRRAVREFAEGLAYFGVCYGHLPPYGWRADRRQDGRQDGPGEWRGRPDPRLPLDEPPPGHPERLVPAARRRTIGRLSLRGRGR